MSYPRLELNDKVAVVIGGTSGIGLAIAKGMAEAGADVAPTSRRQDQVEAASREIENRGRRSIRVTSDLGERASLQRVLNESIKAFGKVDVLVNSAGRTKRAPTLNFSEEDWNSILDITSPEHSVRPRYLAATCWNESPEALSISLPSQRLSPCMKWLRTVQARQLSLR